MFRKLVSIDKIFLFTISFFLVSDTVAEVCGDPLGLPYKGVTPKSNGQSMADEPACGGEESQYHSPYGFKWHCVEFIRRFHATNNGSNLWNKDNTWPAVGAAYKYFYNANLLGLTAIPNGSGIAPQPDDILVFDKAKSVTDEYGHIAIVSEVTPSGVTVVEQNSSATGYKDLPRRKESRVGYWIEDRGSSSILGWLRKDISNLAAVYFEGTVKWVGAPGNEVPTFSIGDKFWGTYIVHLDATDSNPDDPREGYYTGAISNLEIQIGSYRLTSVDVVNLQIGDNRQIKTGKNDYYRFWPDVNGPNVRNWSTTQFRLQLTGHTRSAFSSDSIPSDIPAPVDFVSPNGTYLGLYFEDKSSGSTSAVVADFVYHYEIP